MAQTTKKSHKARNSMLIILVAVIVFCIVFVVIDQGRLTVVNYDFYTNKLDDSIRIVELTDLHNKEFGKNNLELADKIKEQKPDIIAMVGDMNSDTDTDRQTVTTLIEQLAKTAPVYYTLGNHEWRLKDLNAYTEKIEQAGAVLLENKMVKIFVGDKSITLGGISKYPFFDYKGPDFDNEERYFLEDFSSQDDFKLLLNHCPEYFIWRYNEYSIDLTLSGHTHGGGVRVPFLGGIVAPNQDGLFPEYCDGFHTKNNASIIISKGLGSNFWWIPRVNNPPEITVIDIKPEK